MESLQLSEIEQQIADDLRWALRAAEVRQHAGKLVAVHKMRVVAIGSDRDALIAEAAERAQCPWQDVVVVAVPGADLTETPR